MHKAIATYRIQFLALGDLYAEHDNVDTDLQCLLLRQQHPVLRVLAHVVVHVERGDLELAPAARQLHAAAALLLAHLQARNDMIELRTGRT